MPPKPSTTDWAQLSGFIAGAMGLHFPEERWPDLKRGLAAAAVEFGFGDVSACARWLLSGPLTKRQSEVLASHLTIGETYFFRDPRAFEVLAREILPPLIHARRGREQRLRLWSAACCSGEEAYSLAMLLHQVLPDFKDWQVKILATDINPHFLRKAIAGSYSDWSFRNAPEGLKERYFTQSEKGGYEVIPEIKAMVTFAHLNLAEGGYPSPVTDTHGMDLIFCRNVLMYFKPVQIERVISNLHHSLVDDGWLVVSPSETSQSLFASFATRNFPGVILYQKSAPPTPETSSKRRLDDAGILSNTPVSRKAAVKLKSPPAEVRITSDAQPAANTLFGEIVGKTHDPQLFSQLARSFANQGKLDEALTWCDRWIAADKIDSAGHYLRAIIMLEQGDVIEARLSLQRAIYLSPAFVAAHFALGNLTLGLGKSSEAARHFTNVKQLLARMHPDDPLPESDGLTAGRLAEAIAAMSTTEITS